MFWILLIVGFFLARRALGFGLRGCRRAHLYTGWHGHPVHGPHGRRGRCAGAAGSPERRRATPWTPVPPLAEPAPAQRREQAIATLRRRYVADEITVEEYEAGIDRILRGETA